MPPIINLGGVGWGGGHKKKIEGPNSLCKIIGTKARLSQLPDDCLTVCNVHLFNE